MRIAADGRWFYRESEIRRPAMVQLFSSILRRDPDGYFLVTPVEKQRIQVDDAPFIAIDVEAGEEGVAQRLVFLTNVEDLVEAGPERPIHVRESPTGLRPYVIVRNGLDALISRSVYYRIADLSCVGPSGRLGVWSNHTFFELEGSA